jgi:hypothetical protein
VPFRPLTDCLTGYLTILCQVYKLNKLNGFRICMNTSTILLHLHHLLSILKATFRKQSLYLDNVLCFLWDFLYLLKILYHRFNSIQNNLFIIKYPVNLFEFLLYYYIIIIIIIIFIIIRACIKFLIFLLIFIVGVESRSTRHCGHLMAYCVSPG